MCVYMYAWEHVHALNATRRLKSPAHVFGTEERRAGKNICIYVRTCIHTHIHTYMHTCAALAGAEELRAHLVQSPDRYKIIETKRTASTAPTDIHTYMYTHMRSAFKSGRADGTPRARPRQVQDYGDKEDRKYCSYVFIFCGG